MDTEHDIEIDDKLHNAVERLVRRRGPVEATWLAARTRRECRDARIDEQAIFTVVESSTMLVWRPDGTIDHLSRVLDGVVLTQRARAPLADRGDLWATCALQPLLNLAAFEPMRLADGGQVRRAPSGHDVLVGPPGWLPPVERFALVSLRLSGGVLSAETVDESRFPALEEQQHVRALIVSHYRRERWWSDQDDLESRPAELVSALTLARMEDPSLLSEPHPPLDELLHNPLVHVVDEHHFRDFTALRLDESLSFSVTGMPPALHRELGHRAAQFGMAFDQYVVAVLGHLAWRTPFAEDMEPWDYHDPYRRDARQASLPASPSADAPQQD